MLRRLPLTSVIAAPRKRVLLVGARRDARRLIRRLGKSPWSGPPIVGFVDAGHSRSSSMRPRRRHFAFHSQTDPVPVLGPIERLDELVDHARATHVVVAVSGKSSPHSQHAMTQLINSAVVVHWVLVDSGRLDLGSLAPHSQLHHMVAPLSSRHDPAVAATALGPPDLGPPLKRISMRPSPLLPSLCFPPCLPWLPWPSWSRPAGRSFTRRIGWGRGAGFPNHQVSQHEVRRRARDRADLGLRPRHPLHPDRRLAAAHQYRRAAPALERAYAAR